MALICFCLLMLVLVTMCTSLPDEIHKEFLCGVVLAIVSPQTCSCVEETIQLGCRMAKCAPFLPVFPQIYLVYVVLISLSSPPPVTGRQVKISTVTRPYAHPKLIWRPIGLFRQQPRTPMMSLARYMFLFWKAMLSNYFRSGLQGSRSSVSYSWFFFIRGILT